MINVRLKSFSTYGFKSFAEKTELTFDKGITAIVGPNGSGKSNISDAVRWVLGEQSAKYLRGSKMEDVIFSGSSKRRALGVAEVTLNFDNSDQALNIDFAEVSLTRRLYRSGESEYAINKKSCRLKDIIDLMADTGLGKGSMSIIGQNKIDEILNSRPEERRSLFEEAAGIAKYRLRKKEAVHRLDETSQNLTRINDIKLEVEKQVEPLRAASEKTKQFNIINEQLQQCRLTILAHKINSMEAAAKLIKSKKEAAEKVYTEQLTDLSVKETEAVQLQTELDKLGEQFARLMEEIKNIETALAKITGSKAVLDERITNSQNTIARLTERSKTITRQADELEEKMQSLAEEYDAVYNKKLAAQLAVDKLQHEKSIKEQEFEASKNSDIQLQSSILADVQRLLAARNDLHQAEQQQELRVKKREALKNSIAEAEQLAENLDVQYRELLEKEARLKNEKDLLMNEAEKQQLLVNDLNREMNNSKKNQAEQQKKMVAAETRLQFLQKVQSSYEGFGSGIKAVLKANSQWRSQIIGVAAELIKVQPQFVTAIETALGDGAQNIIARDAETAKQAISYLKSNNLGRATFLPLDTVKGRSAVQSELKALNLPGVCGMAYDLIECQENAAEAIKYLLGRVVVAENIDAALKAAKAIGFRMRVVTLDGDVVNAGGSMTGGSRRQKEGFLSRAKDIEKLQQLMASEKKEVLYWQEKIEECEAEYMKAGKKLALNKDALQQVKVTENKFAYELQKIMQEKQAVSARVEQFLDERNTVSAEYMQNREAVKLLREQVVALENKDTEAKTALENIQKKLAAQSSALAALKNKLQDARIVLETSAAKTEFMAERVKQLDNDALNLRKEVQANEQEAERLAKIIEDCQSEKQQYELKSENYLKQLKGIESGKEQYREDKLALINKQQELEEKITACRKNTLLTENSLKQLEIEAAKNNADYLHIIEQLKTDYKLEKADLVQEKLLDLEDKALQRLESRLLVDIAALGPINQAAVEEFEAVNERCEFLNRQYLDLLTAKENLELVISEINSGMTKKFKEAFKDINQYFEACYSKLFGGGSALLKLTDNDDLLNSGIDIEAQPPGKKLQSLYLLSGGERALTVIALLFALLSYQPAPFCILDEIDAALDDANILRFSKFLREYSGNTQFIVITHRKGTMECADIMYGVTMEESGVSKLLSVKINEKG